MTVREGSLEAPQRHPIDWQNPSYYNEDLLNDELHRVYDVCHGCRRCFNLCHAFPTLFDLIDESKTGELDSVDKSRYGQVVDQCYLCDMCFMTKCPYVPPHPLNIDFPHLMLRAKAVKHQNQGARFRDQLLSSTDVVGKLASIPVVVTFVNKALKTRFTRIVTDNLLGIHRDRRLPRYHHATFRKQAQCNNQFPIKDGSVPGKVAIYSTCYINFNEPGIGLDLLRVLEHNEIPTRIVEKEACCGMPKLELGDLKAVERLKEKNIPILAKLAREGHAILAAVPSCVLMYKQELPLLFPDDVDVKVVAQAMFDPFDYLLMRHKDGLLKTDFPQPLGKIAYHVPCHQRVQNIGLRTRELLQMAPGTTFTTVERCSGHDGTWGVKSEFFARSMQIGKPVFKLMTEAKADFISSDCAIAARQIQQGMGDGAPPKHHPITLLKMAYGL